MTEPQIKAALNDRWALALTAWAEARGDSSQGASSVEERLAVIWIIVDRARDTRNRWPKTVSGVCLQPWQFSCWNDGTDSNHVAVMEQARFAVTGMTTTDALLLESLYLADGVLSGQIRNTIHEANHYYAPKAMKPVGRVPVWAKGQTPVAQVGSQLFFRL